MAAAAALAANTWPRSTERVRIVFSVPLPSSVATMSPETSAAISGRKKGARKVSIRTGVARPDWKISDAKIESALRGGLPRISWLTTKINGSSTPSPRPRYVRFCETSLRSSQR